MSFRNYVVPLAIKSAKGGGGSVVQSGVQNVDINDDGDLIVTMSDGTVVNKGSVASMDKNIYDSDNSGVVDDAEKVNGFTVEANVPSDVNDRVKATVDGENLSLFK